MESKEYNKLKEQVVLLKGVAKEYPTSSIGNAIMQIESRMKEFESRKQK